VLSEILDRAADAVLTFVTEGLNAAMNKFNGEVPDLALLIFLCCHPVLKKGC
jgi:hypothetical protein